MDWKLYNKQRRLLEASEVSEIIETFNLLREKTNKSKPKIAVKEQEPNKNSQTHLVTTFFVGDYHRQRINEIIETLKQNLNLDELDKIHILWEDINPLEFLTNENTNKIVPVSFGKQPTYSDLFEYSNKEIKKGDIVIISNADIYFDNTIGCVKPSNHTGENKMLSLTRRHSSFCKSADHKGIKDLCLHYIGSHDVFIYKSPLKINSTALEGLNFTQNIGMGAENRVLYEFQHSDTIEHRYKVYNPCEMIHAFHYHCSNERHYSKKGIHISQAQYNGGKRKHGWVKPWWFKNEYNCPIYI